MRLVVTGGRKLNDRELILGALDDLHKRRPVTVLIEGEAPGLDRWAKYWAVQRGIAVEPYPALWEDIDHPEADVRCRRDGSLYNASAGTVRNQWMIDVGKPDYGLVFPGGTGTADMRLRLVAAGIPFEEVGHA